MDASQSFDGGLEKLTSQVDKLMSYDPQGADVQQQQTQQQKGSQREQQNPPPAAVVAKPKHKGMVAELCSWLGIRRARSADYIASAPVSPAGFRAKRLMKGTSSTCTHASSAGYGSVFPSVPSSPRTPSYGDTWGADGKTTLERLQQLMLNMDELDNRSSLDLAAYAQNETSAGGSSGGGVPSVPVSPLQASAGETHKRATSKCYPSMAAPATPGGASRAFRRPGRFQRNAYGKDPTRRSTSFPRTLLPTYTVASVRSLQLQRQQEDQRNREREVIRKLKRLKEEEARNKGRSYRQGTSRLGGGGARTSALASQQPQPITVSFGRGSQSARSSPLWKMNGRSLSGEGVVRPSRNASHGVSRSVRYGDGAQHHANAAAARRQQKKRKELQAHRPQQDVPHESSSATNSPQGSSSMRHPKDTYHSFSGVLVPIRNPDADRDSEFSDGIAQSQSQSNSHSQSGRVQQQHMRRYYSGSSHFSAGVIMGDFNASLEAERAAIRRLQAESKRRLTKEGRQKRENEGKQQLVERIRANLNKAKYTSGKEDGSEEWIEVDSNEEERAASDGQGPIGHRPHMFGDALIVDIEAASTSTGMAVVDEHERCSSQAESDIAQEKPQRIHSLPLSRAYDSTKAGQSKSSSHELHYSPPSSASSSPAIAKRQGAPSSAAAVARQKANKNGGLSIDTRTAAAAAAAVDRHHPARVEPHSDSKASTRIAAAGKRRQDRGGISAVDDPASFTETTHRAAGSKVHDQKAHTPTISPRKLAADSTTYPEFREEVERYKPIWARQPQAKRVQQHQQQQATHKKSAAASNVEGPPPPSHTPPPSSEEPAQHADAGGSKKLSKKPPPIVTPSSVANKTPHLMQQRGQQQQGDAKPAQRLSPQQVHILRQRLTGAAKHPPSAAARAEEKHASDLTAYRSKTLPKSFGRSKWARLAAGQPVGKAGHASSKEDAHPHSLTLREMRVLYPRRRRSLTPKLIRASRESLKRKCNTPF